MNEEIHPQDDDQDMGGCIHICMHGNMRVGIYIYVYVCICGCILCGCIYVYMCVYAGVYDVGIYIVCCSRRAGRWECAAVLRR